MLDLDASARASGALRRRRAVADGATLLRLALAHGPGGLSLRSARGPGGKRWLRVSGIPVNGKEEGVAALVVVADLHEEKRAAERQDLLAREVDHRAKNMLVVVQAAIRLTRAHDVAGFVRTVEGRVAALAQTQTPLAADRWSGADLHALLRDVLSTFLNGGDHGPRAELRGPQVALPAGAAQPFSMAVH